jgi:hypothetical protein
MKNSFLSLSLFTIILTSCSGTSSSEQVKPIEKDTTAVSKKADSIPEKKEVSKEPEKEVSTTPNGTYLNGQKSKLRISNYSAQGFNFSYKLNGACDGYEDGGHAVFTSKNTAEQYSEDGTVIVSFTFASDGSIEFSLDFGLSDYVGMDCIKFFDSNFVKK